MANDLPEGYSGIDRLVQEALWDRFSSQVEGQVSLFVNMGVKADKKAGKTAKDTMIDIMTAMCRECFKWGLTEGYSMGVNVATDTHNEIQKAKSP